MMAIAFRRLLSLPSFPSFPSLHSLIHPAGVERGRKESGGRGIRVRRPTIYHRLSGSDRQADRPNLGRRGQNLGSERASKERGFLGFLGAEMLRKSWPKLRLFYSFCRTHLSGIHGLHSTVQTLYIWDLCVFRFSGTRFF